MDKTRIIVVEDNIVYCEFVCNLLAREGFRTVQAYHLSTAKKLLQQASDGDIVVSDLRLPDGDGIDLLRWMRKVALRTNCTVDVFFMTICLVIDYGCKVRKNPAKHLCLKKR